MVVGIGIDIVEVARIQEALLGARSMEEKVFTDTEIDYCRKRKLMYQHFAGRFAAKEATLKALGTGWSEGIRWKDVEILEGKSGAPKLEFHAKAKKLFQRSGARVALISITYSSGQAVAVVVLDTQS
tara:strand:+ start:94 stop:474 length:381 start_codon:yes stop_codon:yes gene_type:complete